MHIQRLRVGNFRLFKEKQLDLAEGINLILGDNGVGKTSLLEAVYLFIAGRSFRCSQQSDLLLQGSDYFHLEVQFEKGSIEQQLKMAVKGPERKLHYNSTPLPTASGLLGILQGTLLAPHDIELIRGSPAIRRQYLDLQLAQVDPLYVHHLMRYQKALRQRNFLLKAGQFKAILAFEEPLAHSASYIVIQREKLLQELENYVQRIYPALTPRKESLELHFCSSLGQGKDPLPESFMDKYRTMRAKEAQFGHTLVGPHKDDFKILLNNKEARTFASEGEMRSLAATLRLAEWQRLQDNMQEKPLLLVDDFGISFDAKRARALGEWLAELGQVLITSASEAHRAYFNNSSNFVTL